MGSLTTEKRPLENGNCSLLISPPRYTRRKISAIRDFPDGCGPHAAGSNLQMKEVGSNLQMKEVGSSGQEAGVLRKVECNGEKGMDLSVVLEKISPEDNVESQCHDIPLCPNGVQLAESAMVKYDKVECENEEFPKLPVDNQSSQVLLIDSKSKNLVQDASKNLMEGRVESPSAEKEIGVHDHIELTDAIENKMVDEGNSVQPCLLPHYPIPPNIVLNQQKYPPRRKVSAVRDFPVGCGRIVPRLGDAEDNQLDRLESDSKIDKATVMTDATDTGTEPKLGNVFKDNVQGAISGKGGDTHERYSESEKAPLISRPFESKGQEEVSKDEIGEQHKKELKQLERNDKDVRDSEILPDELNKDIVVYVKDKNKKKSIGVPCGNVGLQEESIAVIGSGKESVVVQGLMSADNCPWKTTPAVASVKSKKRKKVDFSGQDKRKCSTNKVKEYTKILAEKDMMMIPYVEEDIDDISRPLDIKDNADSSENEEVNEFQLLPRPRGRTFDVSLPPFGASSSGERGIRSKVRETLRLFQAVQRKLLQEEETKSKIQENASKRADLRAAKILKDHGRYMNTEKVIGSVPGVEVGDIFNYRIELAIIGLHGPLQAGIDTIKLDKQSVAISIVASGGYANDVDSSDVLIYTGQGGNATGGDKQPEDQKLERGNLALKNCIDKKTLVRVVRGFKESKPADTPDGRSKMIATYTYDGLYTVERYWHDLGPHGKLVYKFELIRVPGQPELAWKEMKQSKKYKAREGRCVVDISEGKEDFPICAVNTINDEKPPPFTYITSVMYPDWCQPIPPKGCDCKNGCSDSQRCACAVKNGGEIPYNHNGAIVQAKPLVYECGPLCKCPPSCHNRVSQHGIKLPLEVFKTDSRGWGVRCLCSIPSGSFICEYIGELLDDSEADQRTGNDEYLFDIGQNYNDSSLWEGLSDLLPDMPSSNGDVIKNVGFTIDAVRYGNIGRFINHSCSPNLYAQNVLYDHEDKRIPHIMLFAAENIPPLQELTYHYNYTIDQVYDSEGNIKKKACHCGSVECTGRMY